MIYDICIVGAGASGMAAAICAGRNGAKTAVLERMPRAGKKILVTGNGRCNISNTRLSSDLLPEYIDYYHGENPGFAPEVLSGFDTGRLIRFMESAGIYTHERDGYLYPMSDQAVTVRNALERAMEETGCIDVFTDSNVSRVERKDRDPLFCVYTEDGRSVSARKLILAAGGCAAPKQGSNGSGYRLAAMLGHSVIEPLPALTALHCSEKYVKDLAGIRCRASVTIYCDGGFLAGDTGELQLTAYGISGIPVFQVSRFVSRALHEGHSVTAKIDYFPEIRADRLQEMIAGISAAHPGYSMISVLSGLMNEKLASVLVKQSFPAQMKQPASRWDRAWLARLTKQLKQHTLHITATNGFDQAQVCCGGVNTAEIDPHTMQSGLTGGLYITGELLDVDGMCGGFNLHWAFATGCIAGTHAAKRR